MKVVGRLFGMPVITTDNDEDFPLPENVNILVNGDLLPEDIRAQVGLAPLQHARAYIDNNWDMGHTAPPRHNWLHKIADRLP